MKSENTDSIRMIIIMLRIICAVDEQDVNNYWNDYVSKHFRTEQKMYRIGSKLK